MSLFWNLLKSCCCLPTEACCLPNGVCLPDVNPLECVDQGGIPKGPGTNCTDDPDICNRGACCPESCACVDNLTEVECADLPGSFLGFGSTCPSDPNQNDCAPGACCHGTDGEDCDELTFSACQDLGGSFGGCNTDCFPNPCLQPDVCCDAAGGSCDCGSIGVGVPFQLIFDTYDAIGGGVGLACSSVLPGGVLTYVQCPTDPCQYGLLSDFPLPLDCLQDTVQGVLLATGGGCNPASGQLPNAIVRAAQDQCLSPSQITCQALSNCQGNPGDGRWFGNFDLYWSGGIGGPGGDCQCICSCVLTACAPCIDGSNQLCPPDEMEISEIICES